MNFFKDIVLILGSGLGLEGQVFGFFRNRVLGSVFGLQCESLKVKSRILLLVLC